VVDHQGGQHRAVDQHHATLDLRGEVLRLARERRGGEEDALARVPSSHLSRLGRCDRAQFGRSDRAKGTVAHAIVATIANRMPKKSDSPKAFFLRGNAITAEALGEMFEAITGRRPTPEEMQDVEKILARRDQRPTQDQACPGNPSRRTGRGRSL
jgi:hypothetical protein